MDRRKVSLITFAIVILGGTMLLIACDLLLGTGTLLPTDALPAREAPHIEMARSRVRIGDERDEAVQALSDAWYHADCRYSDGSGEDLFFYGPRNRDEVNVVLIHSKVVDRKAIVDFIGGVENYMLHLYEHCVPLHIFDGGKPATTTMP